MTVAEPAPTGLRRRALGSMARIGGGAAAGQAITVLVSLLLTRLYSVDAFGTFGTFSAVVSTIGAVSTLAFEQGIVLERHDRAARDVLRLCLFASCAVAVLATGALGLAWLLRPARYASLPVLLLAFVPPAVVGIGLFHAFNAWAVRQRQFGALGRFQLSRAGLVALFQSGAGFAAPSGTLLVAGQVAGQWLAVCGLVLRNGLPFVRGTVLAGYRRLRLLAAASRHRRFCFFSAPQTLAHLLSNNLPILLLPLFFGPAEAGLFWLAWRTLILPEQVIVEAVRQVYFRRAVDLHHAGRPLLRSMLRTSALLVAVCSPVVVVLVAAGPALFGWAYGGAWQQAGVYAAILGAPWLAELFAVPSAVMVSVLQLQRGYFAIELGSLLLRGGAVLYGCLHGSALAAVIGFAVAATVMHLAVAAFVVGFLTASKATGTTDRG